MIDWQTLRELWWVFPVAMLTIVFLEVSRR
jgi:hypothetical protein